MVSYCKWCDEEITFDEDYVSENTGKMIPLDLDTEEPHDCFEWRTEHRKYHECRKGCAGQIYFDEDRRSARGKWIPIDKDTNEPHQCADLKEDSN
jgi:hypothetical protein